MCWICMHLHIHKLNFACTSRLRQRDVPLRDWSRQRWGSSAGPRLFWSGHQRESIGVGRLCPRVPSLWVQDRPSHGSQARVNGDLTHSDIHIYIYKYAHIDRLVYLPHSSLAIASVRIDRPGCMGVKECAKRDDSDIRACIHIPPHSSLWRLLLPCCLTLICTCSCQRISIPRSTLTRSFRHSNPSSNFSLAYSYLRTNRSQLT